MPRTFIFGGKAAPGYFRAKSVIKFINDIKELINNDADINGKIKVVFVENYRVSYAENYFQQQIYQSKFQQQAWKLLVQEI